MTISRSSTLIRVNLVLRNSYKLRNTSALTRLCGFVRTGYSTIVGICAKLFPNLIYKLLSRPIVCLRIDELFHNHACGSQGRAGQLAINTYVHLETIQVKCMRTSSSSLSSSSSLFTDVSMVEMMIAPTQTVDKQTQFGNARRLDSSDCIFVFRDILSDYEEPPSDEEVSPMVTVWIEATRKRVFHKAEEASTTGVKISGWGTLRRKGV
ncbi:hypothetical protein EAI_14452 [Harpegnathos saltator]|uniref:Uncharacterized protein n=1 Tax=Harpegnathos saltator TaxID=610380 RepID=E2C3T6_HARSA|nr:hypothetical protein EAI_14452 [Harpegnathos saltator]